MLWSNKLRAVKRIIYAKGQKVIIFFNRMDPKIFKDKKKRSVSGAISSHMDSFSGSLANPLEDIGRIVKSGSAKIYGPSVAHGDGKPVPAFSSERFNRGKAGTPLRTYLSTSDNEDLKMNSVAASVAMKEAIERERERATKEARERAAAERAAVERAEKYAVQKVQAAVLKRAATAAKERAEKAAAEARERENAEAREREAQERAAKARVEAGKAFVQKVIEEARARAAVEALNRAAAAAAASVNQQNMDARASSAPRPRANFKDPMFNTQSQNMQGPEVARTSSGTASTMRKASSTKNIANDFTSVFGDMEGASERRQSSRLERKNSIEERVAKALAEKNQRDLQIQNEQAERNRIAEKLDVKIGHWSSGKKGDIRALLSTLQHILGPDCGWQQVSLIDLKSNDSVKKMYKKSALCVHPDKVQQRGANLEQKYISEKVFDLLKKAWEQFNSKEHI